MTKHAVVILPKFLERAAFLPKDAKSKLVKIMWLLSEDFRHPSLQTSKIQGAHATVYECRVDSNIRLIYDMINGALRCW